MRKDWHHEGTSFSALASLPGQVLGPRGLTRDYAAQERCSCSGPYDVPAQKKSANARDSAKKCGNASEYLYSLASEGNKKTQPTTEPATTSRRDADAARSVVRKLILGMALTAKSCPMPDATLAKLGSWHSACAEISHSSDVPTPRNTIEKWRA